MGTLGPRPVGLGPRVLGPRSSASGLGPPDQYSVDRELILESETRLDSSLYIELWANQGDFPLVGCLDVYKDRVGDEVRLST